MDEIDWHKVHSSRLAACCRKIAADLNLSVTTPFSIQKEGQWSYLFTAHFPHVGSGNGTLVCLAADWDRLQAVAHEHGYTCVGILPEACSSYDKARWEAFVKEWLEPVASHLDSSTRSESSTQ